jgi:anti-sigma factor ChrR (cupin superfamily)
MLQKGGNAMTAQQSPLSQIISVNDLAWQEMQPGARMKHLWTDEKTNRRAVLGRIEPGVPPSLHRHVGDELVFVLEGTLADEFGTVTAGNVGYRPNGCVHGVSSPQGATVLAIITGGIEPAKERGSAPPSQIFPLHEVAWVEAMPGVRVKPIWEDKAAGRRAILARFEPGATLPRHRHVGDELIFVIEGASVDESGTVTPGNLNYRPQGCVHTVSTQNGATVFAVVWGHVEPVA